LDWNELYLTTNEYRRIEKRKKNLDFNMK